MNNRLTKMAPFWGLALCLCLMSFTSTAVASVIDAPHNETNTIQCGDCHTYSLWWKYSPAENQATYTQIANDVCNKCHGQGKPFPNKLSHSYDTMGVMHKPKTGNWETKCVDCHDPHLQGQLDWTVIEPGIEPDLFLATGLRGSSSFTYGSSSNTTTFDYVSADAQTAWTDPALWGNKSDSGRGLILVGSDSSGSFTFEVNAAVETTPIPNGTGTIEVQGQIPSTFTSGSAFSLFYGQLLRQTIHTPNDSDMPVKFFDPGITYDLNIVGGPADPITPTPMGICQVCHYYTRYHNYDRLQPDPSDGNFPDGGRIAVISHNENRRCDECHATPEGFKPVNADHTFMSSTGTDCAYCHMDTEDFAVETHNSVCEYCHDQTLGAPALISSISTGTAGKWPSTPHEIGDCTDCHDANGPGPDDIVTDFTNHPKAFDSDENPGNGLDGGHVGQLSTTPECANNCHFHRNKDLVKEVHTGGPTPTDPCIKCHELSISSVGSYSGTQMIAKGTYTGSGRLINSATAGQGDCANCHTGIASNWKSHPEQASHAGQVDDTGTNLCNRCHQYNPAFPEEIVDIIHYPNGWCGHCHDGLNKGALIGKAEDNGAGDCVNCHTSSFYLHSTSRFETFNHETYGLVTPEPPDAAVKCMICHNEGQDPNNPPGDTTGQDMILNVHSEVVFFPAVPNPEFNICGLCHDDQGYLIGSASGHGFDDLNGTPNTCSTCHMDKTSGHPSHIGSGSGSEMNGSVTATISCTSCHVGDRVNIVHNNDCLLCHDALFRQGIKDLKAGLPNPYTSGDADGHLECIECHTKLGESFFSLDSRVAGDSLGHDHDHQGKVESDPGCANCHYKTPALYEYHWDSGLCTACHWQDGMLRGSASGNGTGKPPVGIENDCRTCHGDFNVNLHSSASGVNYNHPTQIQLPPFNPDVPSCNTTGCHDDPDLVLGIHNTNGCASCHSSNGALIGSASGNYGPTASGKDGGGDCLSCHTTYFDGHQHGTNAHYLSVGANVSATLFGFDQSCTVCHQGLPSWAGTMALHNPTQTSNCTTCHTSTRTAYVGTGFTSVPDVILVGSQSNPIYCLDCHDNASDYGHYCGNGVNNGVGEQCDDGNLTNGDGCDDAPITGNCTPTGCGNGVITAGETCDDGNTIPGDGCDATCQTE